MLEVRPTTPNYADPFPKDVQIKCRKMPNKFRMYPDNGQNVKKSPKILRKCQKFPTLRRKYRYAYYAESNAGIFRLALFPGLVMAVQMFIESNIASRLTDSPGGGQMPSG
jgi:hypothetical protein